jgi:hypothetical protein
VLAAPIRPACWVFHRRFHCTDAMAGSPIALSRYSKQSNYSFDRRDPDVQISRIRFFTEELRSQRHSLDWSARMCRGGLARERVAMYTFPVPIE